MTSKILKCDICGEIKSGIKKCKSCNNDVCRGCKDSWGRCSDCIKKKVYGFNASNQDVMKKFDYRGSTVVEILEFLKGKPFDDKILAYIYGFRPSSVRISYGSIKLDAHTNRVTIWLDEKDTVRKIYQEIDVGLPDEIENGYALDQLMENRN